MKKIKIISIFILFAIGVISHFAYDFYPNSIFAILFPVNESIWEHMKLLATPLYIYLIIEYFIFKRKNISTKNLLLSYSLTIILSIILFLYAYKIISLFIKPNMFIHISLLLLIYIFDSFSTYYFSNNKIKLNIINSFILLFLIYSIFTYYTYNPLKISTFYDIKNQIYGIKKQ